MEYKGTIKLDGKQYNVSVVDGKRFIDGLPVDDFVDNLIMNGDINAVTDLIEIGTQAAKDIVNGEKKESYQSIADTRQQTREN